MALLAFARRHPRPLMFGALRSFHSSPGQTFVIGLFIAAIGASLAMEAADAGGKTLVR